MITTFRLSVPRARTPDDAGSSQSVDWVDCTAWSARGRRSVERLGARRRVEVGGALRRRFFRGGVGSVDPARGGGADRTGRGRGSPASSRPR